MHLAQGKSKLIAVKFVKTEQELSLHLLFLVLSEIQQTCV